MKLIIKKRNNMFINYILMGTILSVILNLYNVQVFYIYQFLFAIVYILISTGVRRLTKIYAYFNNYILLDIGFICLIGSCWLNKITISSMIYNMIHIVSFLFLMIAGYIIASSCKDDYEVPMKQLNIFIIVSVIWGVYTSFIGLNPLQRVSNSISSSVERISSFYVHPIPCSCFFTIGAVLSFFLIKNTYFKVAVITLNLYGVILTKSRSSWIIILTVFVALILQQIIKSRLIIKKKKFMVNISIVAITFMLIIIFRGQISLIIGLVQERIFGNSISEDMSYTWRFMAIQRVLQQLSILDVQTYIGHGFNTAATFLQGMDLSSSFSWNVGTVDNSYITLLYDFGLVGFVMYVSILVYSVIGFFRDKDILHRCIDCMILVIMLFSFFFEAVYWANISFLLATLIGYKQFINKNIQKNKK